MMKKFLLWIIAISVIAPLVLVGFLTLYVYLDSTGILVSYDNYVFQNKLHNALNSEKTEIPLKDLTDFEWDEVEIYYEFSGGDSSNDNCYVEKGSKKQDSDIYFYLDKREIKHFKIKKTDFPLIFLGECIEILALQKEIILPIVHTLNKGNKISYININDIRHRNEQFVR